LLGALVLVAISWKRRSRDGRVVGVSFVALVLLFDAAPQLGCLLRMQGPRG
jgi:hypothetical protein